MLTRKHEAHLMGISERTLRRWMAAGKIDRSTRACLCWCGRLVRLDREPDEPGLHVWEGLCECGTKCRSSLPAGGQNDVQE